MSYQISKGTGIQVPGTQSEVYNIRKDWLLWDWRDNDGHWFSGKREAMRFLKYMREVKNVKSNS